jgi:hypothetical protein
MKYKATINIGSVNFSPYEEIHFSTKGIKIKLLRDEKNGVVGALKGAEVEFVERNDEAAWKKADETAERIASTISFMYGINLKAKRVMLYGEDGKYVPKSVTINVDCARLVIAGNHITTEFKDIFEKVDEDILSSVYSANLSNSLREKFVNYYWIIMRCLGKSDRYKIDDELEGLGYEKSYNNDHRRSRETQITAILNSLVHDSLFDGKKLNIDEEIKSVKDRMEETVREIVKKRFGIRVNKSTRHHKKIIEMIKRRK